MGENIQDIINEIESGAIKECTQTNMEGVLSLTLLKIS